MVEYFENDIVIEVEPEIEDPPSWPVRILILVLVVVLYPVLLALRCWDRLKGN